MKKPNQLDEPGKDVLKYSPSKVGWGTAEFVRKPPAFAAVAGVYVLIVSVILGLGYTYVGKIPVTIKATGVLLPVKKPIPIISTTSAKVLKLEISEGDIIKKGRVLVVTDAQIPNSISKKLLKTKNSVVIFTRVDEANRCRSKCLRSLKKLSLEAFAEPIPAGTLRDYMDGLRELLNQFIRDKTNEGNIRSSLSEQYRQLALARSQLKSIEKQNMLTELGVQVERLKSQIGSARSQIREKTRIAKNASTASRERLKIRLDSMQTRIENYRKNQTIRAPQSGVVRDLTLSAVGQQLTVGQKLMSIINNKSSLYAEVLVANKDIAKIKEGMETLIKLEALPEREYGHLKGIVTDVPVSPDSTDAGLAAVYKIKIKLQEQFFQKDGKKYPFKMGMSLTSQLVIKRERIIMLGIKKILNLKDSMLGE